MQKHLITTIIPTYRRPHLLKKAIQSVLAQTYPHFELLICDNASGDETKSIVEEFEKKDSRIKYICHPKNIGMIANYQFGISRVTTDFFSFLSDDDVLLPHFYETVIQEFKKYPDAGFVAGSTVLIEENGKIIRVPLSLWKREGKFDPPDGVLEMIGKYPVPTSVLFRKKATASIAIDSENPTFWDCDYLLKIASSFPIVISKNPCALFRVHPSSHSNNQELYVYEDAFSKLLNNIKKNKSLSEENSKFAEGLILFDLAQWRLYYVYPCLKQKKFDEAHRIANLVWQNPDFKFKSLIYIYVIKFCKLFPVSIFCLNLIRNIRFWMKKRIFFTSSMNKKYASKL